MELDTSLLYFLSERVEIGKPIVTSKQIRVGYTSLLYFYSERVEINQ